MLVKWRKRQFVATVRGAGRVWSPEAWKQAVASAGRTAFPSVDRLQIVFSCLLIFYELVLYYYR